MDQSSQSPLDIDALRFLAGSGEVGVELIARILRGSAGRVQSLKHILETVVSGLENMGDAGAPLKEAIRVALAKAQDDFEKQINLVMQDFEAQMADAILDAVIPTQAQRNTGKLKEASEEEPNDETIKIFAPHDPVNVEQEIAIQSKLNAAQETLNRESARAEQARKDREAAEAEFNQFSDSIQKQFATLQNYEVEQKKHIAELEKRINDLTATLQRLVTQIAQKQAALAQLEP